MKCALKYVLLIGWLSGCGGESPSNQLGSVPTAVLVVTDSPTYDYGPHWVDSRTDKTFTVTNTGLRDATNLSASFNLSLNFSFAGGGYPGEGGTCATDLAIAANCKVVVRLEPRYIGNVEEILKINYHDGSKQTSTTAPVLKAKGIWDSPGNGDLTLAAQGRVIFPLTSGEDTGRAVAMQSDGKILMAGSRGNDVYVQRLLPTAEKDPSFGADGRRDFNFGAGAAADSLRAMSLGPDGKILLAGKVFQSGFWKIVVARLHNDGSDDTGWNGTGRASIDDPLADLNVDAISVMADRSVLLAGNRDALGFKHVFLARLLADGSRDNTFGTQGLLTSVLSALGNDVATSIAIASGQILIGGTLDGNFLLARYNWDGTLDTAFASAGKALLDIDGSTSSRAQTIRLQSDGKILVAGYAGAAKNDFAVARFLSTGALDTTFGVSGKVTLSLSGGPDQVTTMAIQSDKKILLAGRAGSDVALARLLPTGALDTLFGTSGKAIFSFAAGEDHVNSMALQSNGKILIVGETHNGSDFDPFLARVWP